MRSLMQWFVGLAVASTLAVSAVPSAAALEIDGDLFWRNVADVHGVLDVNADTSAILVQKVPAGAAVQEYAWSMAADKLTVYSSKREEAPAWSDVLSRRNSENEWENRTYQFTGASVRVALTPARDHGATGLFYTQPGDGQVQIRPLEDGPAHVRIVGLGGDLMQVPESADSESNGHAYAYPSPEGRLLEVSGRYEAEMSGNIRAAFFGWTLTVETDEETPAKFETGIRARKDPTTGLNAGTILEYVTVYAENAEIVLPSMRDEVPLYTSVVRYSGHAEYPEALYVGRHAESAPQGGKTLPIRGDIWLSAIGASSSDASQVRAWGDADWQLVAQAEPPVVAPPASAAPLFVALAGLSLSSQILPGLVRAARSGLFLLYARLRDQEPNANPTRERIYEAIVAEPGLNLSRIVDRLDIGWGTAAYHVQILKRQTRVRELRFLNRVCFFPSENPDEAKQLQTVLLRQPNYREVMDVVEAQPGLSQREVAGRTGHARQYISRLVAKMERAGLLRTEPSRLGRRYFPVRTPVVQTTPVTVATEAAPVPRPAPPVPPTLQPPASPY